MIGEIAVALSVLVGAQPSRLIHDTHQAHVRMVATSANPDLSRHASVMPTAECNTDCVWDVYIHDWACVEGAPGSLGDGLGCGGPGCTITGCVETLMVFSPGGAIDRLIMCQANIDRSSGASGDTLLEAFRNSGRILLRRAGNRGGR